MTAALTVPILRQQVGEEWAREGRWSVHEMKLSLEKVAYLWAVVQRYPTLFSDATRGDVDNFTRMLTSRSTMWFELWQDDRYLIGMMWLTGMEQGFDVQAHMAIFDHKPTEKATLIKQMISKFFRTYPIRRMTAELPAIFFSTIRLLLGMGFKHEGERREAVLLKGKWVGVAIYGITRTEVEA